MADIPFPQPAQEMAQDGRVTDVGYEDSVEQGTALESQHIATGHLSSTDVEKSNDIMRVPMHHVPVKRRIIWNADRATLLRSWLINRALDMAWSDELRLSPELMRLIEGTEARAYGQPKQSIETNEIKTQRDIRILTDAELATIIDGTTETDSSPGNAET